MISPTYDNEFCTGYASRQRDILVHLVKKEHEVDHAHNFEGKALGLPILDKLWP